MFSDFTLFRKTTSSTPTHRPPMSPTPPTSPSVDASSGAIASHVDIDALLEDYVWRRFLEARSIKGSGLEAFKSVERADAEFDFNRRKMVLTHAQPEYNSIQLTGTRPNTIFKSVFTNNTSQVQAYSLKTERCSESICGVSREQGFMFGAEAELTLKTPCEVAELKTNFKHEIHFNKLTENIKSETLVWAVDNNIVVPPGGQTEASIVIEEMSYHGKYCLVSSLSGVVTVAIRRLRDGVLMMPISANVATIMNEYLAKKEPRLKGVVSLNGPNVLLKSKGICHFQFAVKQYVELNEANQNQRKDYSGEMARLNMNTTNTAQHHNTTVGPYQYRK
ncbi:hypothetical protein niasHT_037736 [Heterodera trifolii]|uniref:Vitellogenin n=1 Tax=Heterodera trifolii TaxID=157864 RepID=A0ABD2J7N2_9BILA